MEEFIAEFENFIEANETVSHIKDGALRFNTETKLIEVWVVPGHDEKFEQALKNTLDKYHNVLSVFPED